MKEEFIKALESKSIEKIKKIPKGDLHNHITRGGNKRYIEEWSGTTIPSCPKFKDLEEMNKWNAQFIKPIFKGKEGYEKRIEAAFVQAKEDGVKVLHMSITIGEEEFYENSVERLIQTIKKIHNQFAPEVIFVPELAFLSHTPLEETYDKLLQFLEHDYFMSLDMFGNEYSVPSFKKIYRKAKEKGLILKAHVGEFGSPELVKAAVEELELDQVQHGIAAAYSQSVMNWLRDNKIQLNTCPTSNVFLLRTENYLSHPIRILYDNGIRVTINSDDMIIFDQSVSQEFLNLYNCGLFTAVELNEIRENGLHQCNYDKTIIKRM